MHLQIKKDSYESLSWLSWGKIREIKRSSKKIIKLTWIKIMAKEKIMVSIYDPGIDAYREVPLELAEKFVESAKEVEKAIKKTKEK